MNFNTEYDDRAYSSDYVGDYQRPVAQCYALNDEENRAEAEHAECRQGYAVGVAGADGGDCLR